MSRIEELLKELEVEIKKQELSENDLCHAIVGIKDIQVKIGQVLLDRHPTEQNCSFVIHHVESLRAQAMRQISSKVDNYLCHIATLAPPLTDKIKKMLIALREKEG